MRDSAAGDSRAADLIGRRARCRPLSYDTFDGDRADVTTLETMMRMVERKMRQDSLHPDVPVYVVRSNLDNQTSLRLRRRRSNHLPVSA